MTTSSKLASKPKSNNTSNNTSFGDAIKQAIKLVKLDSQTAINISKDPNSIKNGIIIIIISGLIFSVQSSDLINLVINPILLLIFTAMGIGITHILAKLFGGIAEFKTYFGAESHVSILGWLNIVLIVPVAGPIIILIISLWQLVVNVNVLKNIHKLSTIKSIIVVLLPVIVFSTFIIIGAISYFSVADPNLLLP